MCHNSGKGRFFTRPTDILSSVFEGGKGVCQQNVVAKL